MADLRDQIEAILASTDQAETVQGVRTFAHAIAVFVLELEASGLTREEALLLGSHWLRSATGK